MAANMIGCLVLALTVCGAYGIECPNGWTTYHGSCYLHGRQNMTYSGAEQFCRSRAGSHLVHINNHLEQLFVQNYLATFEATSHWIGVNDRKHEGNYTWTDHRQPHFFYWAKGQPDNHNNQDCVAITQHDNYHWKDEGCARTNNPLCEYTGASHAGVTPTPTQDAMTTTVDASGAPSPAVVVLTTAIEEVLTTVEPVDVTPSEN